MNHKPVQTKPETGILTILALVSLAILVCLGAYRLWQEYDEECTLWRMVEIDATFLRGQVQELRDKLHIYSLLRRADKGDQSAIDSLEMFHVTRAGLISPGASIGGSRVIMGPCSIYVTGYDHKGEAVPGTLTIWGAP